MCYNLRKGAEIMTYIHERDDWPNLRWQNEKLSPLLIETRYRQGRLLGRMEALGFPMQNEAVLKNLTEDVLKSSEIEGEVLDKNQVRSSIARRLGLDIGGLVPADRSVDGVVEMMLDATQHFDQPLTKERLFSWHAALFPTGYSGLNRIRVAQWRDDKDGPMQVLSGPFGRERVHYEAPAAPRLDEEMSRFLDWFEEKEEIDPVIKAAVAHLWFVTVHPFEDGNGRIARAIADMALARSEDSPQRFYSMSAQIRSERDAYYRTLEVTQKGNSDITNWLTWFLECLGRAFYKADESSDAALDMARFWERYANVGFNDRQRLVINRFMGDFEGKLTSSKWAKLAKTSQDTASRDINDMVEKGILVRDPAGGRSTSYSLVEVVDDGR